MVETFVKWTIEEIKLPLKFTWAISRGSTDTKTNYVITVSDDNFKGRGEIAVSTRYGESHEAIKEGFKSFVENAPTNIDSKETLIALFSKMQLPASLRAGIECAYVQFLGDVSDQTVPKLLELNTVSSVATSFSLPILPINEIGEFVEKYDLKRFSSLKIKVDEKGIDAITEICNHFDGPLRIDANEAFESANEVLKFMEKVDALSDVDFLEQPMPSSAHNEYIKLKKELECPLIADESLTDGNVLAIHADLYDGVNIKIQKAGGYIRALKQMRDARKLGLKTMLGCMVETSLGISAALDIAHGVDFLDLDGFLFLKDDPFGLLNEEKGRLFQSHFN